MVYNKNGVSAQHMTHDHPKRQRKTNQQTNQSKELWAMLGSRVERKNKIYTLSLEISPRK